MPLFLCAEFLYGARKRDEFPQKLFQELFQVFLGLKNVNDHEQTYLDLLPRSCISKTAELFPQSNSEVS